jgi:adenylosuccinate lyase
MNSALQRLASDARLRLSHEFLDAILAKGDRESGAAKSQIAAFSAAVTKLEATSPEAAAYKLGSIL